jgi:hypothetical protein
VNTERKELSTVHKQLIASGVTALHLQRFHEKFAKATGSQIPTAPSSSSFSSASASSSSVPAPPKFDYSKVKPKDVQPLPVQYQQAKDFFGRPVVVPTPSSSSSSSSSASPSTGDPPSPRTRNQAPKASIIYKFHEGYTNAVRRTVFVKDFL